MATIKVRVQGEIATNLTPEVRLVCQNDKYDVEFEFDESWENSNFKTALFIYNGKSVATPFDRQQSGNICKIPALYDTELLHIGVKSNDVDGLHTSTPARVGCLLSANDIANGEIPNPTPSQYDEIIALLNKYISGSDLSEYQKKVDENLPTTDKTIVGAIAEVKEIAETAKMVFGETEGTAYEGNKGKANADNIAKLQNEMAVVNVALEQSGLVKKYKQPITQEYNERVTADGANVLDGSKAVLKNVVGNTVAYDKDENDLNGKLANASFGGMESKNANQTETSTLVFPKTETPIGVTIDFDNMKITDYGVDLVLTGMENFVYYTAVKRNGVRVVSPQIIPTDENYAKCVSTDGTKADGSRLQNTIGIGQNNQVFYWYGILDHLGWTTEGVAPTAEEQATAVANFKAWIAQRYADGNPVKIRYISSVLQSETDFTADNEYTAYKGGTEKVLENDGNEYGADNTLTQDYILVTAVE